MIVSIKCDGCNKTLNEPSDGDLDLCSTCASTNSMLSDRLTGLLEKFTKKYGTIATVNAMDKLFIVMERRLATIPPIPEE